MDYLEHLRGIGLKPASVARKLSAVRSFYRHLAATGSDASFRDPTEHIDLPRSSRRLPKTLSLGQMKSLVEAPDPRTPTGQRNRAMLELLYASGMRASECLDLRHQDVNLAAGYLVCTGKGRKQRLVPVGAQALHWLEVDRVRVKGKSAGVTLFTPVPAAVAASPSFGDESRLWQLARDACQLQHWDEAIGAVRRLEQQQQHRSHQQWNCR